MSRCAKVRSLFDQHFSVCKAVLNDNVSENKPTCSVAVLVHQCTHLIKIYLWSLFTIKNRKSAIKTDIRVYPGILALPPKQEMRTLPIIT